MLATARCRDTSPATRLSGSAGRPELARIFARWEPGASLSEGCTEEPLTDEVGEPILIRYRGKPSRKRYEFIRDYLDLKIKRLERDSSGIARC